MVLPIIRDKNHTKTFTPKKTKMAVDSKIPEAVKRCNKKYRDITKHLRNQPNKKRELVYELDKDINKKLNAIVRSHEKCLDEIIRNEGVVLSPEKKKKNTTNRHSAGRVENTDSNPDTNSQLDNAVSTDSTGTPGNEKIVAPGNSENPDSNETSKDSGQKPKKSAWDFRKG